MIETVNIMSVENGTYLAQRPEKKRSSSRRFWGVYEKSFKVSNPDNVFVIKGQCVEIELNTKYSLLSSFTLFILPLLVFPLVFYIVRGMGLNEGLSTLAALGGVVLSISANRFLYNKDKHLPVIVKISKPDGSKPEVGCAGCGACG